MYKIRRLLVWLRRWKYSRGFGVQSPWAYRFIRYVVNEHYPYYAYNDLLPKYTNLPKRTLKLCRLYFRIANYWQPAICLDYGTTSDAYGTYMRKGGDYRNVFDKAVQVSDSRTLIVVEQIKRDKEAKRFWKSIERDPRCVTTFDLYYCGIIFFDKKRYKENYIVNF